jgi:hypothetical protein
LFKQLTNKFQFNEYSLYSFIAKTKNSCHIKDHLDINTYQKIATRVFRGLQEYSFAKRDKPKFKGINQPDSAEGKTNTFWIRWRYDQVVWRKLNLRALFDTKDKCGVEAHALACRVKYARIVRRKIQGENKFFAQLLLEGKAKVKHPIGDGVVGLGIGPSTVTIVSEKEAILTPFRPKLDEKQTEIRRCS